MKTLSQIALIALMIVLVPALACASLQLTIGGAGYVGSINDGIPSSPANEVIYINTLTGLAAGTGDTLIGSETYNRVGGITASFTTAVTTNSFKTTDESLTNPITLPGLFQYVLGKYDAGAAGSLVWFFPDGVSDVELPETFGGRGLSHISAYNTVVPEPGTIAVWGLLAVAGYFGAKKYQAKA